jgi:hypothetical protein
MHVNGTTNDKPLYDLHVGVAIQRKRLWVYNKHEDYGNRLKTKRQPASYQVAFAFETQNTENKLFVLGTI